MKKDKLQINGLQDLTVEEMAINGGFPWGALGKIAKWVAGVVVAWAIEQGLDAAFSGNGGGEEDIYYANYDGGTLDPAYCYG